jgi:DNA-binding transcriptional LysR family regulator
MSAVFPASHRFRRKKSIQVGELLSEPLILTDRDSTVRHLVDSAFAALGRAVVPVQEVTYMSTAIGMVKVGLGVAVLPSSALELDQLRPRPARSSMPCMSIYNSPKSSGSSSSSRIELRHLP